MPLDTAVTTSAYSPNHDAKPLCTMTQTGPTLYVILLGALDWTNRSAFKAQVLAAIEAGARDVTIDFAHCHSVDSTGLGVLVSLLKNLRDRGGWLTLALMPSDLRTLFQRTKLDALFTIREERVG